MASHLEPSSVEHLLKRIAHAMDEADYVRKLMKIKEMVDTLNREYPFPERLKDLNHKIQRLERNLKHSEHKQ